MCQLSIITVTYNDKENLKKTINSLKNQSTKNFEFIVIDGKSSDGSDNIIKENMEFIDIYVSEEDNGIYDAMNKGIKVSKGEYIMFLNSGDILYEKDTIKKLLYNIEKYKYDIIYGDVIFVKEGEEYFKKQPSSIKLSYLYYNNLCHQTMIIKKDVFSKFGLFNIENRIFADYEMLFNVVKKKNISSINSNNIIVKYNLEGVSSKLPKKVVIQQRYNVVKKYGNSFDKLRFVLANLFIKPFNYFNIYFINKF